MCICMYVYIHTCIYIYIYIYIYTYVCISMSSSRSVDDVEIQLRNQICKLSCLSCSVVAALKTISATILARCIVFQVLLFPTLKTTSRKHLGKRHAVAPTGICVYQIYKYDVRDTIMIIKHISRDVIMI